MGVAERRQRERDEMRERILETAMRLFVDEGFERVTMRRIAAEIEYSTGAIYRYFEGKDAIYLALRRRGFDLFYQEQLGTREIEEPLERLRAHCRVYLSFALANPEYYDLMFIMKAPMRLVRESGEWAETVRSLDLARDDVELCMEKGYIPKEDLDVATLKTWALLHGIVSLFIRDRLVMHTSQDAADLVSRAVESALSDLLPSE